MGKTADKEVDLLVIGAGAGGMTAALSARLQNLDVLLCEKASCAGGITATSGGTTWVPGTHLSVEAGVPDTVEAAQEYLDSVVGNRGGDALRKAFLESGPQMIRELTDKTDVQFAAAKAHPDYVKGHPGEAFGGRALAPLPFDGKLLKSDFDRVRPPRPEFMGLGGMMVNRNELNALLNPLRSIGNLKTTLKVVLPYFADRLRYKRGTRLVMGNALVGRLLYSLIRQKTGIWFDSPLKELCIEDGRVTGAVIGTPDGDKTVIARKGVVLATGGIAWNKELRARYFPEGARDYSFAPTSDTGDGLEAGFAAGGARANEKDPVLWFPSSFFKRPDGQLRVWPHIILDRAKPGLIAVNNSGKRFVNESDSYHDFCVGQIRTDQTVPSIPAYMICDDKFIHKYGLGLIMPGGHKLDYFVKNGYVVKTDTLEALAGKIGADASHLIESVKHNNEYAVTGIDTEFGRGSGTMNRFNGDPDNKPNPCIGPIQSAPFYALAVKPVDCAGSMGLSTDEFGRVLTGGSDVIGGLYACGNDMASIFRGTYPGPGTTIGPAMVFGWRIGRHAAGTL